MLILKNQDVHVLVDGEPGKLLLFEIDVTEEWKWYEKNVVLRISRKPNHPVPFGIMILRKNPNGVSSSNSIMTYM